jgi:hypothetical protein
MRSFNCLFLLINLQLQLKMRSMSLTLQRLCRCMCVLLNDRMLCWFLQGFCLQGSKAIELIKIMHVCGIHLRVLPYSNRRKKFVVNSTGTCIPFS